MSPVVCMITDRARYHPDGEGGWERRLVHRVAAAALAGVHLVQVREPDLDGGALLHLVRACLDAVRSTTTRIIVNERFDVALAARAHGVHLRGDSMSAARVRRLAPSGFIVGRSVHARDEAIRADGEGGLDYLVFGPVFPTRSKPGRAGTGVDLLGRVTQATPLPVLAVGGITATTAQAIARAGAAGFAGIGVFADGDDDELRATIVRSRSAFDTP